MYPKFISVRWCSDYANLYDVGIMTMMKQHHHPFHLGDCDHKTWHVVRGPPSDTLVSRHNDSNGALCEDHPYILHFLELQLRLPLQHRQVIITQMYKERGPSTCLMKFMFIALYSHIRFCLMNIVLDCVFCSANTDTACSCTCQSL